MDYAATLALFEAVRDGHLGRASKALNEGADVNHRLGVTRDESTKQLAWDFFGDGHITWRHIITVTKRHYAAGHLQESPGVLVVPCDGDTLLHVAAKLQWRALLQLLATRVELNEFNVNALGQTARDCADEIARGQVQLSDSQLVEEDRSENSVLEIIQESSRLMRSDTGKVEQVKGQALALYDACLGGEAPAPVIEPQANLADRTFFPRPAHLYSTPSAISAAGARSKHSARINFEAASARQDTYKAIERARLRREEGPLKLASHWEQPRDQPDPMPRGNDETVIPRFPRGQRVPVELPGRSWRAPTLNETAGTVISSPTKTVPTVAQLTRRSYGAELQQLKDSILGKRFLILRPTSSLVTVKRVGTRGDELVVTFICDHGDIGDVGLGVGEVTKTATWFKANSRLVRG